MVRITDPEKWMARRLHQDRERDRRRRKRQKVVTFCHAHVSNVVLALDGVRTARLPLRKSFNPVALARQARERKRRQRAKRRAARRGQLLRTYEELIEVLKARREELGMSQLEFDDHAGFQAGYTGKLELGYKEGGRGIGNLNLPTWLDALGVRLTVVLR